MKGDELEALYHNALGYGIELSQHQLDLFRIYLDELLDWNRKMNLTGISKRERIVNELILDSLIPAPYLTGKGRMLDVGSGAGFPGLPIKIYNSHLETQLLEANSKKVSFLKQIIRLLKLDNIEVVKGRIERNCNNLHPSGYDFITARAVARLDKTIEWCTPFLSPDGLLVCFLGNPAWEVLKKNQQTIAEHTLTLYRIVPYFLPGKRAKRNSVILKKATIDRGSKKSF